jgi:hypothetical protein
MYEMTKKRFTLEVPDLKHAPTTLVTSLEDYVKDLEEGRTPEVRALIESKRAEKSSNSPVIESNERNKPEPKAPQPAFNLIDDDVHTPQPAAQSLIDPFGVGTANSTSPGQSQRANYGQAHIQPPRNQPVQQPRTQQAAFDPFGNDPFATPANQFAHQKPNNMLLDPFAATVQAPANSNYNNPFSAPQQQSYEEKAQHIKAAFTPTLQPTAANPFATSTTTSPPNAYPKPNYNVNVGPGAPPMAMVPYGVPYPNAPVPGQGYTMPTQQMTWQQPQNQPYLGAPGAPRSNNLF